MTVNTPPSTVLHQETGNESPKRNTLAQNALQNMQTEQLRLSFLLRCRLRKRPPPSLRCTGFKALDEGIRIKMISDIESIALQNAIAVKQKVVKLLKKRVERSKNTLLPLSKSQMKKQRLHFNRKINFYKSKELTTWASWPRKDLSEKALAKKKSAKTRKKSQEKEEIAE